MASNINIKYFWFPFRYLLKLFKKINSLDALNNITDQTEYFSKSDQSADLPQQTFSFEKIKDSVPSNTDHSSFKNFKLPSVDLLEKKTF